MQKKFLLKIFPLFLSATILLSSCSSGDTPKLGGASRITSTAALDLVGEPDLASSDGVIINSSHCIELTAVKLNALSAAYAKQLDDEYITAAEHLSDSEDYWMADRVTTENYQFDVRLTGDDSTMTLDIRLLSEQDIVIAPSACIINGVVKDLTLFKGSEPEKGHFVIKANMSDFERLSLFNITMENISSIAWVLSEIGTSTKAIRSFLLASSFPVSETWGGLPVSENYSIDSGIVMWIARDNDAAYLCTFNGSEEKISKDVTVSGEGGLISDMLNLDVASGECAYNLLGYELSDVRISLNNDILFAEKE